KLAGLPPKHYASFNTEDFIAQAREFEAMDADKLNLVAKWLSTVGTSHPWTVLRANHLLRWVDEGGFQHALDKPREVAHALPAGIQGFCTQCGHAHRGDETFCPGCGRALRATADITLAPPPASPVVPEPPPAPAVPPVANPAVIAPLPPAVPPRVPTPTPPPPTLPPPLRPGGPA
ncbi:MAG: hypothetical protein IT580_22635, partial [Verrucomicrobiales bacterium]|nr:hypothetical protein [Verrucomicrobiales bacterium]